MIFSPADKKGHPERPSTHIYCPTEGTLTAWYVQVGQQVETHTIVGTMTDRQGGLTLGMCRLLGRWAPLPLREKIANVPILSPYSGRVSKIWQAPGTAVGKWAPLLTLTDARDNQGRDMSHAFHHHLTRWLVARRWRHDPTTLAIALKVSGPTSWRWLTGHLHPTEEQFVALTALLGVSEDERAAAWDAISTIPPITLPGQPGESEA